MIGKTISHYQILSKLGEGGMGVVYKALDTTLDRHVAIKILPPQLSSDQQAKKRFISEAKAASTLNHANIAVVHRVDETPEGQMYIVMACYEGDTLKAKLESGPLRVKDALAIASEVASGIGKAHQKGILHRDIKPANILLGDDGQAKVADFGLAKLAGQTKLTKTGHTVGTVAYMSPEQAGGGELDERSDIFSLGVVLYESLTGVLPFKGDHEQAVLYGIMNTDPAPLADARPGLPPALQEIVDRCLEKDPERRYQSALDLAHELEGLRAEVRVGSDPSRPMPRPRPGLRTRMAIGAAVVTVALLGFLLGPRLFGPSGPPLSPLQTPGLAIFGFGNLQAPDDPERLGQIVQELLITDLSGLDDVKVFSNQRLKDIQKQVDASGERGSGAYEEIAKRAGATAMLTGMLSRIGEKMILTCQVVDVAEGTVQQSTRIDGTDLYAMVDRLSRQIQQDHRLSGRPDTAGKVSVRDKTTGSLEALRHYLAGVDYLNDHFYGEAQEEFEKAIEIDPEFGQAYYKLAVTKSWGGSSEQLGGEELRYLLENRLYASEKEKRMAQAMEAFVSNRLEEALPIAEALARDYPDEKEAWYILGEVQFHYPGKRELLESAASSEKAIELDPDFRLPWTHIHYALAEHGETQALREKVEAFLAKKPSDPYWNRQFAKASVHFGSEAETELAVEQALLFNTTPMDRGELYKEVGLDAMLNGFHDEAVTYFRKGLEAGPETAETQLAQWLVSTLFQMGRYDELEEVLEEYFAEDTFSRYRERFHLFIAFEKGQFDRCLSIARKQSRERPESVSWLRRWGSNAILAGDDAEFEEMMAEMERRSLDSAARKQIYAVLATGQFAGEFGDYNKAKDLIEKAMELGSENDDLFRLLGTIECGRGRIGEARRLIRRGLAGSPDDRNSVFSAASFHLHVGELDSARIYAEKEVKLDPRGSGQLHLAAVDIARGDFESADRFFSDLNPRLSINRRQLMAMGLGREYLKAGHPEKAEAFFRQASEMRDAPTIAAAYAGVGWALLIQEDYSGARDAFLAGLDVVGYRQRRISLLGLSALHLLEGRPEEAERYIRKCEELARLPSDGHRLLAYILAADGRYEEARTEAERAVAMDSTRASNEVLAWVLISGKLDLEAGIEAAWRAASLQPATCKDQLFSEAMDYDLDYKVSAEHSLGLAYLERGDAAKAIEYLGRAAALHPRRASVQRDLARAREAAGQSP